MFGVYKFGRPSQGAPFRSRVSFHVGPGTRLEHNVHQSKICEYSTIVCIDQDVVLGYNSVNPVKFECKQTHAFEITMYEIRRMQILYSFGYVQKLKQNWLVLEVYRQENQTHKAYAGCFCVRLDILHNITLLHPGRYQCHRTDGIGCRTQEGQHFCTSPHNSFFVEHLRTVHCYT